MKFTGVVRQHGELCLGHLINTIALGQLNLCVVAHHFGKTEIQRVLSFGFAVGIFVYTAQQQGIEIKRPGRYWYTMTEKYRD